MTEVPAATTIADYSQAFFQKQHPACAIMLTNQEILRFHLALFGPMWLSNTSFVVLLIMTMITSEETPAQKSRLLNTECLCGVVQLGGAASYQRDVFLIANIKHPRLSFEHVLSYAKSVILLLVGNRILATSLVCTRLGAHRLKDQTLTSVTPGVAFVPK